MSDARRSTPVAQADRDGIEAALGQARAAASGGEIPVGAVVVRDGVVVAEGHNESARRGDPTAHAELLAIQRALQTLGTDRLADCTLYVTLEPCAQCAGAMVLAKVGRLVFGAYDDKAGMAGSIGDLVRRRRLNHHVDVQGGVLAEPCAALLVEFFKVRR